jgi:hypothetical protein
VSGAARRALFVFLIIILSICGIEPGRAVSQRNVIPLDGLWEFPINCVTVSCFPYHPRDPRVTDSIVKSASIRNASENLHNKISVRNEQKWHTVRAVIVRHFIVTIKRNMNIPIFVWENSSFCERTFCYIQPDVRVPTQCVLLFGFPKPRLKVKLGFSIYSRRLAGIHNCIFESKVYGFTVQNQRVKLRDFWTKPRSLIVFHRQQLTFQSTVSLFERPVLKESYPSQSKSKNTQYARKPSGSVNFIDRRMLSSNYVEYETPRRREIYFKMWGLFAIFFMGAAMFFLRFGLMFFVFVSIFLMVISFHIGSLYAG